MHFIRDEVSANNAELSIDNSQCFKYNAALVEKTADAANNILPRREIKNFSVLIDGRNFYDQPIHDLIKQYDEVRKVSAIKGDDYTTGCLLDYTYFKDKNTIVVPSKSLSNFWRSLEMPLIKCKIHLELNWIEDCILSSVGDSAKIQNNEC